MAIEIMDHIRKNGLGTLMGKYEHFSREIQDALFENKKALAKLKRVTEEALFEGGEKIKDVAVDAHRSVKKNPWAYLGAASALGLFLGFVIGRRK